MFGEDGAQVMNSKINNMPTKVKVANANTTNKNNSNNANTTSKYTEDWIKIKGIQNGMIILPGNERVTGVKIFPRNIFILDPLGQEGVLNAMRNFYNQLNFEFWMIAADRPVDISVYQSQLQIMLQNARTPGQAKIIAQDIDKANMFVNNQVVDTEYYILFKEKSVDEINRKIRVIINGLAQAGLNSSQTSNDDLRTILDNFLNGGVKTEFGTVVLEG
jgi:hypothetical protein